MQYPPVRIQRVVLLMLLAICVSAFAQGPAAYSAADTVPAAAPDVSSVTADRTFPVSSTSAPIRWTANVSGSSEGLQFRFWRYSARTGQWQMGRDWSTDNTWLFHPSPLYEGRNVIQVWVRTGSAGDAEASRNSDDFELGPATPAGDWTPTYLAVSGFVPSYYDLNNSAFSLSSSGRTIYVTVLHYSTRRLFQFAFTFPTYALVPGTYSSSFAADRAPFGEPGGGAFTVHSIEPPGATAGSLAVDFGSSQLRIHAREPLKIGNVVVSHLNPIAPYTMVTLTVDARAGDVPLEYRFIRRAPDGTQDIQEYSHANSLYWAVGINDGTHTVTVWIRRRGSTEAFEWVREAPILVGWSPAEMVSLTADRSFPAPAGSKIRWTATARGGNYELQFKFWRYSFRTSEWTVARDWSYDRTWVWQSTALDEGPHLVQAWVKSRSEQQVESFRSSERFDLTSPTGAWMLMLRRPGSAGTSAQMFVSSENTVYSAAVGSTSVFANFANPPDSGGQSPLARGSALLQVPREKLLAPGLYDNLWSLDSPYLPRMVLTGVSPTPSPCRGGSQAGGGTFRILEIDYTAEGVLRKLAADAQQSCDYVGYYTQSAAIRINSTLPLFNFLSLTSNVAATVAPRTRVEWRAAASSGTGGVEYKFWLYRAARAGRCCRTGAPTTRVTGHRRARTMAATISRRGRGRSAAAPITTTGGNRVHSMSLSARRVSMRLKQSARPGPARRPR